MESGETRQKEAVEVPNDVAQSPRGSGGADRKGKGVMPNEGTNEAGRVEWDFGGSGGRAAHTKSPSDQRVIQGCSNSQKIAKI